MKKTIWILKGFVLGGSGLIPGVSAGTLALIMGIYEKIIFSLDNLFSKNKKKESFIFLLCLTLGGIIAIFTLTEGIAQLISHFPLEVYALFTGLIIGSLYKLFQLTDKTKKSFLWVSLIAIAFYIALKLWPETSFTQSGKGILFLSGFVGFFAGALPGLSGSAVLLLMGTYHLVLEILTEKLWGHLLIFLLGGVFGLITAFYIIRFFLKKRNNLFFCIILGLIIGGLPQIIPWEEYPTGDIKSLFVWFYIFIGIGLFFLLEKGGRLINLLLLKKRR